MQFLVFHLGKDRYGFNTEHVSRVLPLMELKQLPQAPVYVAGLMNLHGTPVPVIDLCALALGSPCTAHFDTRILLVDYLVDEGTWRMLGLIVERVTGVEHIDPEAFSESGLSTESSPYLGKLFGKVAARDKTLIQLVDAGQLLTEEAKAILFPRDMEEAG